MTSENNNFFVNGRQPQLFIKRMATSILLKMEDDLKKTMQPNAIKIKTMVVAPLRVVCY
jgi:hypothetical protein